MVEVFFFTTKTRRHEETRHEQKDGIRRL